MWCGGVSCGGVCGADICTVCGVDVYGCGGVCIFVVSVVFAVCRCVGCVGVRGADVCGVSVCGGMRCVYKTALFHRGLHCFSAICFANETHVYTHNEQSPQTRKGGKEAKSHRTSENRKSRPAGVTWDGFLERHQT